MRRGTILTNIKVLGSEKNKSLVHHKQSCDTALEVYSFLVIEMDLVGVAFEGSNNIDAAKGVSKQNALALFWYAGPNISPHILIASPDSRNQRATFCLLKMP